MAITIKEIAEALGTSPEQLAAVLQGGEKMIALLGDDMQNIIQEGRWSKARKVIAETIKQTEQRAAVLRAEHEQQINEARQQYIQPLEQERQATESKTQQELAKLQALATAIESGDLSQSIPTAEEIDKRLRLAGE